MLSRRAPPSENRESPALPPLLPSTAALPIWQQQRQSSNINNVNLVNLPFHHHQWLPVLLKRPHAWRARSISNYGGRRAAPHNHI
eukprot:3045256-Pyramimonas_sp.AAC.1